MKGTIRLSRECNCTSFDCGKEPLNKWLQKYALQSNTSGSSFTYVALDHDKVVGYYSFAVGSVERGQAPARIAKGLAGHPIPILLLARLAVDRNWQKTGLGTTLMLDFLQRACNLAIQHVPLRCVVVDAKDEESKLFYKRFDFEFWPLDSLRMWILMKDLRKTFNL